MSLGKALKRRIRSSLKGLRVANLSRKKVNDLYELYVLSIFLQGAANTHATIRNVDQAGMVSRALICPTSPRAIGKGGYTHFTIAYPNKPVIEAHLGVFVIGQSQVQHECDVSLIDQIEANRCRVATVGKVTVHPDYRKLVGFAECKCYEKTNLSIGHGRAFIGLCEELHSLNTLCAFVSTKKHTDIGKLLKMHRRVFSPETKPGNDHLLLGALEDMFNTYKL